MLTVTVVAINQQLNFEAQEMANIVVLRLPDGKTINATVDDVAAQSIISAHMANGSDVRTAPASKAAGTMYEAGSPDPISHDGPSVFGGDVDAGESPAYQDEDNEPVFTATSPEQPQRAPKVSVDEKGYPILRTPDAVPVERVTGDSDNKDEDGVGSV
jgi:hypothetical protein